METLSIEWEEKPQVTTHQQIHYNKKKYSKKSKIRENYEESQKHTLSRRGTEKNKD